MDKRSAPDVDQTTGPDFEKDSWAFALSVYARPGVSEACLRLQSSASLDVMMMLSVVYAAVRLNMRLTEAQLVELDRLCTPWRLQVVRPLRAIRVQLKSGPAPAPSPETEALRTQIKASELAAERLQAALVASFLAKCWAEVKQGVAEPISAGGLVSLLGSLVELSTTEEKCSAAPDNTPDLELIAEAALSA